MAQKFANNARGRLSAAISAADTSLTLLSGESDRFPVANLGVGTPYVGSGDWFKITIVDANFKEIIYARTRTSGSQTLSNLMRGQEGTTARDFDAGAIVGARLTADDVERSALAASVVADQVAALQAAVDAVVGGNAVPAGAMIDWPTATPPSGWFIRNGQAVSRAENPNLFELIGVTFGAGDGSTTFNLPDDVTGNRFTRAAGGAIAVGTLQDDQNKEHTHTATTNTTGSHVHTENRVNSVGTNSAQVSTDGPTINYVSAVNNGTVNTSSAGGHAHNVTVANDGGSEARPKARAWLPLIRGG